MSIELNAEQVTLWVHTRKEGVLSRMGHDLRLRAERLSLRYAPETGRLELTVPADALRVEGALQGERLEPGALSASDRAEIERNVRERVLESRRHPTIRFEGTVGGSSDAAERPVEGTLALHGAERPLRATARLEGGTWQARVRLDQRDFGIRPFKAPLGVLKVQPHVDVLVQVPAEALS